MLDQVRPEGGTPGMLWLTSEQAGAEKASHANCAVVSPAHPSGGSGLVVAMHGRVEEGAEAAVAEWMCTDYVAFIVYVLPRGLLLTLVLRWCWLG